MYLTQNNFLGHHPHPGGPPHPPPVATFDPRAPGPPPPPSTQTQTITLRSMSSRMERSEMRDLVDSSAKL